MLDGVSLDQLRTFIAAVDEGSFSAAARKLHRVQSAVSGWVGGLEDQIGVVLFDRTGRFPKLTAEGVLLLADARNIVSGVDTLKARAKLMASGLETELSVVVDVFFPTALVSAAAKAFANRFPLTPLRLFVEGLGAAYKPVLDGRCSLGILSALPVTFPSLVSERLGEVPLVSVAAANHPLASFDQRIPRRELAKARPACAHRQVRPHGRPVTSASCRRRPGDWPTCRPSTRSSKTASAGVACPCTWSRKTSLTAHWLYSTWTTCLAGASC